MNEIKIDLCYFLQDENIHKLFIDNPYFHKSLLCLSQGITRDELVSMLLGLCFTIDEQNKTILDQLKFGQVRYLCCDPSPEQKETIINALKSQDRQLCVLTADRESVK